jgi:hypothetical protein
MPRSTAPHHPPRSLNCAVIPLPRINHFLLRHCHYWDWNAPCIGFVASCNDAAEKDMKIYLLMMLIGALLAATYFTSAREQGTKSLPH